MEYSPENRQLVFAVLGAASHLERMLSRDLSTVRGISLSEYLILESLGQQPGSTTRVDLAASVGLTPSGVTRCSPGVSDCSAEAHGGATWRS